jgi:hypothetical protein
MFFTPCVVITFHFLSIPESLRSLIPFLPHQPFPIFNPSFRECKGRNLFVISKTYFFLFFLSFDPLFFLFLSPRQRAAKVRIFSHSVKSFWTFSELLFNSTLAPQITTPFAKRSQMYRENILRTKRNFQIIKTILQLPVNYRQIHQQHPSSACKQ